MLVYQRVSKAFFGPQVADVILRVDQRPPTYVLAQGENPENIWKLTLLKFRLKQLGSEPKFGVSNLKPTMEEKETVGEKHNWKSHIQMSVWNFGPVGHRL
jgi:hypothetical protein